MTDDAKRSARQTSDSQEWYTPPHIVERVHQILGGIDFDPASCPEANKVVRAKRFLTERENGLVAPWPAEPSTVYCNPPGGLRGGKSYPVQFWARLLRYCASDRLKAGIFMGFTLDLMQTSQSAVLSVLRFPFCVPKQRLRFNTTPDGREVATRPPHANVIVLVAPFRTTEGFLPGEFEKAFRDVGDVVIPSTQGRRMGWTTFRRRVRREEQDLFGEERVPTGWGGPGPAE
ncbi:MAG: hypothetical protein AAF851_05760 [Myxococcota bacterium]